MTKTQYSRLQRIEVSRQGLPESFLAWESIELTMPVLKVLARKRGSPDRPAATELVAAHAVRVESLTNLSTTALRLLLREITALEA